MMMMHQELVLRAIQMEKMMTKMKISLAARKRSQLMEKKTEAKEPMAKIRVMSARAERTANATTQMSGNQPQQTKRAPITKRKKQSK